MSAVQAAVSALRCARCGARSVAYETRHRDDRTRVVRRRRCPRCGHHWTTDERTGRATVQEATGRRQLPWLYLGHRTPADPDAPLTTAEETEVLYLNKSGTWQRLRLAPFLETHELKSPAGFNWGYAGSGPAELARHLLWHATGRRSLFERPALYQKFKTEVVAGWGHAWIITGDRIRAWVLDQEAGEADGEPDE